jgi:alkylation response protein AidB-like acyl-CoA dehydrogenase
MSHYKSNRRDIEFNLFEVLDRSKLLGTGPFDEVDEETARDMLAEVERLAAGPVAESWADSDRNPPVFDPETNDVTMPESFKKSYRALMDAEWWRLSVPPELGGTVVPRSLNWAVASFVLGANPAAWMYSNGPTFANILWTLGTPEQKEFARLAVERQWGATMVLTEADAGSDVGAGRAKATEQPDGTWHIEGVKRFITTAEHDMTENIFHLVLARPEGAGPGTKGLSMFLVPKYLVHDDGSLGERNGVVVTNLEHKMGLKVSTTCELTFGAGKPAVGTLVGGVHDGIRQMFMVIEHARMMVGAKAIETLSTAYLNALDFARNRVQGADLTRQADKGAPRVTIINHPDVRRMLMLQKSYAEGLRALVLYTATQQDAVQVAALTGAAPGGASENSAGENSAGENSAGENSAGENSAGENRASENRASEHKAAAARNDLLLPVIKGVGSERAYEMLTLSLQTLGGSGFLQDYPMEQYIRDAKIDSLYEGTTAIQSLDFFFRKIVRDGGAALGSLLDEISQVATSDADEAGTLKTERAALADAIEQVQGMATALSGYAIGSLEQPAEAYKVGQHSVRFLMAFGDLVIAWLLTRQAEVAASALGLESTALESTAPAGTAVSAADRDFYVGKLAAARFFTTTVLPRLESDRKVIEQATNDLMDVPESAF